MVDDSIVRGTTSMHIVELLRRAGAKEVYVLISSPPVVAPCFYGIDTSSKGELIAARMSVEEIRKTIGADYLGYLSAEVCWPVQTCRRIVFAQPVLTGSTL